MVTILRFVSLVAGTGIAGIGLLGLFRKVGPAPMRRGEILGLAFVLGTAVLGLELCLLLFVGVRITPLWIVAALGVWLPGVRSGIAAWRDAGKDDGMTSLTKVEKGAVLVMLLASGAAFFGAASTSDLGWDAAAFWGYKGKVLAIEGTYRCEAFTDPDRIHYHAHYPLFVPSLYAAVYLAAGAVEPRLLRIFLTAFAVAFSVYWISYLRRHVPRREALLAGVFLLLTPALVHDAGGSMSGYADVPTAVFAFISASAWMALAAGGGASWAAVASVAMAASASTKFEGMSLAVIIFALGSLLLLVRRTPPKGALLPAAGAALLPLAFALCWHQLSRELPTGSFYIADNFTIAAVAGGLWKLPEVLRRMVSEWITVKHWGMFGVMALLAACWKWRRLQEPEAIFFWGTLLQTLVILGIYVVYPLHDIWTMMRFNDMRFVLHTYPCALAWAFLAVSRRPCPPENGRPMDPDRLTGSR